MSLVFTRNGPEVLAEAMRYFVSSQTQKAHQRALPWPRQLGTSLPWRVPQRQPVGVGMQHVFHLLQTMKKRENMGRKSVPAAYLTHMQKIILLPI